MAYIMLLATGEWLRMSDNNLLCQELLLMTILPQDTIDGFDAKTLHPYASFMSNTKVESQSRPKSYPSVTSLTSLAITTVKLGGGGWKRRLTPNKDLVVSELKRRDPTKRPNKSNRGADEIVGMWEKVKDPRDLAFIKLKEAELREQMSLLLEQVCRDANWNY